MKNYHIAACVFIAGLMIGCSVPAKAETVTDIDTDACTVSLNNGEDYTVDCDELEVFEEGNQVSVVDGGNILYDEGTDTSIYTE